MPSVREQQVLDSRGAIFKFYGEKEYNRRVKHVGYCAMQLGVLSHYGEDYGTRWEDPHPWPCEEE